MSMKKVLAAASAVSLILTVPVSAQNTAQIPTPDALIPADAAEFKGHFYKVFQMDYYELEQVTGMLESGFDEMTAFCVSQGGYPAEITSAEEDAFVFDYIKSENITSAFFGLTNYDMLGDGDTTNWKWVSGEPFEYQNWGVGEPEEDEYKPRHVGMYYYEDGTWHAGYEPNRGMTFICEWGK